MVQYILYARRVICAFENKNSEAQFDDGYIYERHTPDWMRNRLRSGLALHGGPRASQPEAAPHTHSLIHS